MSGKGRKDDSAARPDQVQRVVRGRLAFGKANCGGTRAERAKAAAVLSALQRTSTPQEFRAGYDVDLQWPWENQ
jgi:hypothetical protein